VGGAIDNLATGQLTRDLKQENNVRCGTLGVWYLKQHVSNTHQRTPSDLSANKQ